VCSSVRSGYWSQSYQRSLPKIVTRFNRGMCFQSRYCDVAKGKYLAQNIQLQSGEVVVVP
jgi:hypothetical protein